MGDSADMILTGFKERRSERRVPYTAIIGFKEYNGRKLPPIAPKPNASAVDLSLGGIRFVSQQRPKGEFLALYLPDGTRAIVHVVAILPHEGATKHQVHRKVLKWLTKGEETAEG